MNMMCRLTILLLVFVSLFSCSGNKKELTISEKDIEGYWVSGYLLHNSELSRTIASTSEKKPMIQLLRLKNSVNGFADTSYKVRDNILIYRTELPNLLGVEIGYRTGGASQVFLITFFSKDRLILKDLKTLEETTYYNIKMIPASSENFVEISFGPAVLINDSGAFRKRAFPPNHHKIIKINDKWKEDINSLVRRVNWNAALFLEKANKTKSQKVGEFEFRMYDGPRINLGIRTAKHKGEWKFEGKYASEPILSVLNEEMKVFENYCYYNKLLPLYHTCGID